MTAPILHKLGTALRLGGHDRRLVAEALAALVVARARTLLPFRVLARQLGGLTPPPPVPAVASPPPPDVRAVVHDIRWAVVALAPWLPFRSLCLQQAIAARTMLSRRGIDSVLHLGVDRSKPEKLGAHAWLDTGGMPVTGYPVDPALVEVGRFTTPAR
ncbi:hypothetical protein ASE86_14355 [Sphingomonas sp. Leaf33]|uniref:lasso peptide biosynthesis B2 protein n=1 Tax=Sphingomonas sp. Leaf33 TaxID=1736215 RepID=UPI0006FE0FE5|nr:lasso peptide biosynthesis B2 protein [Sphingomonas sp. Leaf33]KQN22955.1 hypothetical protein ASE86_14355 [Sphingomonas sp. Leaf33]